MAFQRETELVQTWDETNPGELFTDPYFPADARSLYFDPLYPPKGGYVSKHSTNHFMHDSNNQYSMYSYHLVIQAHWRPMHWTGAEY